MFRKNSGLFFVFTLICELCLTLPVQARDPYLLYDRSNTEDIFADEEPKDLEKMEEEHRSFE